MASCLEFLSQRLFPVASIDRHPHDTQIIAWDFDVTALKGTDVASSQMSNEVTELEQNILPRSRLQLAVAGATTDVVRR
ncbi:hypothetical protein WI85_16285 [Burkholderia ubonensis]|nr:hypothetical protein WI85_16285 [Burkholderia ubonensis]